MADNYDWWRKAIAGENPPIHENEPQAGYFKVRRKGEPWEPVAIWPVGGELVAIRSGKSVSVSDIWTWAARHPVAHKVYQDAVDGKGWPEDIDADIAAVKAEQAAPGPAEATIGHNSAPEHEVLMGEIETLDAAFDAWIKERGGTITTEEDNAKTVTWQERYAALAKKAKDTHEALKRPIIEAGRTIDANWKRPQERAKAGKDKVGAAALAYRVEKDRLRREAEAKAAEEARIAREAAAKAAAEAAEKGEEAPPPPPPVQVARPAPTGLRTVSVTQITDLRAAVLAILDADPQQVDIFDAVKKVATRMIKAGVPVAGAAIVEEKRA